MAAPGGALPSWNRHQSCLLEAPCWVTERRGPGWQAVGGQGGPLGSRYLHTSVEMVQHFNSL